MSQNNGTKTIENNEIKSSKHVMITVDNEAWSLNDNIGKSFIKHGTTTSDLNDTIDGEQHFLKSNNNSSNQSSHTYSSEHKLIRKLSDNIQQKRSELIGHRFKIVTLFLLVWMILFALSFLSLLFGYLWVPDECEYVDGISVEFFLEFAGWFQISISIVGCCFFGMNEYEFQKYRKEKKENKNNKKYKDAPDVTPYMHGCIIMFGCCMPTFNFIWAIVGLDVYYNMSDECSDSSVGKFCLAWIWIKLIPIIMCCCCTGYNLMYFCIQAT